MKTLILASAMALAFAAPVYADKASDCADTANIAGAVAVAHDQGIPLTQFITAVYTDPTYTPQDRITVIQFTSMIYDMGLAPDVTIKFVYDMCMASDS